MNTSNNNMLIIGGAILLVVIVIVVLVLVFSKKDKDKDKDLSLSGIVSTALDAALKEPYDPSAMHPLVQLTVTLTFSVNDTDVLTNTNSISELGLRYNTDGGPTLNDLKYLTTWTLQDDVDNPTGNFNSLQINFLLSEVYSSPTEVLDDTSTLTIRPYYIKQNEPATKINFGDTSIITLNSANQKWTGLIAALDTVDALAAYFANAPNLSLYTFDANPSTSAETINYEAIPDGEYILTSLSDGEIDVFIEIVDGSNITIYTRDRGTALISDVNFFTVTGVSEYVVIRDNSDPPIFYGIDINSSVISQTNQLLLDSNYHMILLSADGNRTTVLP